LNDEDRILGNSLTGAIALAVAAIASHGAVAQSSEPPYKGKQIKMVIASGPGGGYDTYARVLSRYMPKHIPGEPTFINQNMDGAGGITAANWAYNIAPKDGTVILSPFNSVMFEPLFGNKAAKYDPLAFAWLGSIGKQPAVCVTWKASPVTSLEDAKARESIMAASGIASNSATTPKIINEMIGTKFKIVPGYGTTEGRLAVERGEADGLCQAWGTLRTTVPGWLQNNQVNILVQTGSARDKELPNVPLLSDLVSSPTDKAVLKLLNLPEDAGRPFIMPPGTPVEMAAILRKAFQATMSDPEFLAEAQKVSMDIDPVDGMEIQTMLAAAYASPAPVVARASSLLGR
jgi:tripartite-type tricarboxylate transporter receptor subunit TctC